MECETLGLKWTCSLLCPSRSGNGVRGAELVHRKLMLTNTLGVNP